MELERIPGRNLLFFNIFSRWSHSLFAIKVNNRTCKLLYTSSRPYYEESAIVLSKNYFSGYKTSEHYDVECQFKKEQIGTQLINDYELYNQVQIGDTVIFTLQNGFFNIPVIKDKTKQ